MQPSPRPRPAQISIGYTHVTEILVVVMHHVHPVTTTCFDNVKPCPRCKQQSNHPPRFPEYGNPEEAGLAGLVAGPGGALIAFVPWLVASEASLAVNVGLSLFLAFTVAHVFCRGTFVYFDLVNPQKGFYSGQGWVRVVPSVKAAKHPDGVCKVHKGTFVFVSFSIKVRRGGHALLTVPP